MRSSEKVAIKMRNAMVASLIKHPKKTEEMEISRAEHKDAQNSKVSLHRLISNTIYPGC